MKYNFPNDTLQKEYAVLEESKGNIIAKLIANPSDFYLLWKGSDRVEFNETDTEEKAGLIRVYSLTSDGCRIQYRAKQSLAGKQKERNLLATGHFAKRDFEYLLDQMDCFSMEISSNLKGMTPDGIRNMAENIASETFIKHGNSSVAFTLNDDLRKLVGGRYQSYPELSKFVIKCYNEKQIDLILSNL